MKKIGLLNGPNLDRLGKREPEVYGSITLADFTSIVDTGATPHRDRSDGAFPFPESS